MLVVVILHRRLLCTLGITFYRIFTPSTTESRLCLICLISTLCFVMYVYYVYKFCSLADEDVFDGADDVSALARFESVESPEVISSAVRFTRFT